jgi:hypothetical protein
MGDGFRSSTVNTAFFRRWRILVVLALGCLALVSRLFAAPPVPPPPGRGLFIDLVTVVRDAKVRVSFYQSTRFWQDPSNRAKDPNLVIRIYRHEVPGLVFGIDYEEILNDLDPKQAKLVWDGPLPAINERKYEFTDTTVEIGKTYAYWVSSNLGDAPTGPKAARVRDPATFWNQAENERRIDALAKEFPGLVTKERVGTTVLGRPIHALIIGNRQKCIALVGSVHAGESGPELILPALENLVRNHADVLARVGIAAIPIVNIDQRERLAQGYPYYLRKNAAGVDINRNFAALWGEMSYLYGLISSDPESATYFGPAPESEPEVRAVTQFVERYRPLTLYSYHWVASVAGTDLVHSVAGGQDAAYLARCQEVAKVFVEAATGSSTAPHTRPVCTGGSLATLMWARYGVPAFDMEGKETAPFGDMPTHASLAEHQAMHTRGILATLRHFAR